MKSLKRYFAFFLAMALCLTACGPASPSTTTGPADSPKLQTYLDAVEVVKGLPALMLNVKMEESMTVGGETFTVSTTQSADYRVQEDGSRQVLIRSTEDYGDYQSKATLIFSDGKVFSQFSDRHYETAMSQEDFLSGCVPTVLLDASLYGSVTNEGNTLYFSQPKAGETWLVPEDAELIDASGKAVLVKDALWESEYTATYTHGPAEFTVTVNTTVQPCDNTALTIPEEERTKLESLDAFFLMERAYGYLFQPSSVTSSIASSTVCQAAGVISNQTASIDTFGTGQDRMVRLDQSSFSVDYSQGGKETEQSQLEVYRDGVYTSTLDDGEPQTDSSVTAQAMDAYAEDLLTDVFLDFACLDGASLTDVGGIYLIKFVCSEDTGATFCQDICQDLFQNPSLLDSLSSAYRTDTMEYYVAVDGYTLLPTAAGLYYEGIHTIEGDEYFLSQQVDQSFYLASLTSYKTITEEYLPEEKPETPATPLLYHVTGANGQEMWLMGTIHVGDERTAFLPQEVYDALAQSDALAVEHDIQTMEDRMEEDEEFQSLVSDAYFYNDGTTTGDHLDDPELYDAAMDLLKATGSNHFNVPYMKVALWASLIDNASLQAGYSLLYDCGLDERLLTLAKEQGKEILNIEPAEMHLGIGLDYTDPVQQMLLEGSLSTTIPDSWQGTQELYELWCQGDEAALREALKDDLTDMTPEELELYQEYNNDMLISRNANMLEAAKEYLESGKTVFYAVGLAHLLCENALVDTLREAGYTVEQVEYSTSPRP